jgi:putative hydrolase of the HAD superfamily
MAPSAINTLFLDIGGVLLTNGWDTDLRKQTAQHFGLDYEEIYHRHHVTYDIYEEGKMTLDGYLWQIVFYEPRPFTPEDFKSYLLEQANHGIRIDLVSDSRLRVAWLWSAASREIAEDRIRRFKLKEFVDFFIVSAFVHIRKPDLDIYRLAMDVAHVKADQVAYVEDRPLLCDVAARLGLHPVLNRNAQETREKLAALGLVL